MKRALIFAALALVFLVWTFPHRRVVEQVVSKRLAPLGVTVTFDDVSFSWWPLGYYIEGVTVSRPPYSLNLTSLYVSIHWSGYMLFDADGCGGTLRGSVRRERRGDQERPAGTRTLEVVFDEVDPAKCLDLAGLTVAGTFGGELLVAALGRDDVGGRLSIEGRDGYLSGTLPSNHGNGRPIGEWNFKSADIEAKLRKRQVLIESAKARAEKVDWLVDKARIAPSSGPSPQIVAELKARPTDDSPRAKAIMGLLPKAGQHDGWRRYRVSGTLSDPHIIGLK